MKFETYHFDRGIATATFEAGTRKVHLEYLRCSQDRRSGTVSAELKVSIIPGPGREPQPLHRSVVTLTASRAQQELVRHLEQREEETDWLGILDAANWRVIDSVREGKPAILLRDAVAPPDGGVILPPLLPSPDPTILFGDGGSAKSYYGLAIALSLHTGRELCGLEPQRKLRVAYLDFEWEGWPHRRRMEKLCGRGEEPDLVYVPCMSAGPLSSQIGRLQQILHRHGTEYIVVDSVGLAAAGPPEDSAVALDFFQALGQLEVGALLIAHVNRAADTQKPFGSAFWHNSARATWYVEQTGQEPGKLGIALRNRKMADGPKSAPIGMRFDFTDSAVRITEIPISDSDGPGSLADQIEAALAIREPQTYSELGNVLGADPAAVRITVQRSLSRFWVDSERAPHRVSRRVPTGENTGENMFSPAAGRTSENTEDRNGHLADGPELETPPRTKGRTTENKPPSEGVEQHGGSIPPVVLPPEGRSTKKAGGTKKAAAPAPAPENGLADLGEEEVRVRLRQQNGHWEVCLADSLDVIARYLPGRDAAVDWVRARGYRVLEDA